MNKPIMSTFVFLSLLFLIENTIASDVILSVVEGNSITIPGGGIRIDKIHAVSWFKGEKAYQYQQGIVHSNNRQSGRFSIVNSYGDLMIQNVSRDDAGYYTVQVIESGEELSETNTYHLDVY
ncbi:uncharacterized protein [Antedon mediterranea]|uniref:uncharacterized protein n=1 Tax=Antedon mediterranea TaxID=105859 RepID=UPI003AF83818